MEEGTKLQAPSSREAPSTKLQRPQLEPPCFMPGETVYSAVSQNDRGMVIAIELTPLGYIYKVSWAEKIEEVANHYAIELSREPLFTTPTR